MSDIDLFSDGVAGLASQCRVPLVSPLGKYIAEHKINLSIPGSLPISSSFGHSARMLGYYQKGVYRQTRDYALFENNRDEYIPVALSRNGIVFWHPLPGYHSGVYEAYGYGPPGGFEFEWPGDMLLAYSEEFQPHRKFNVWDLTLISDPPSSGYTRFRDSGNFSAPLYTHNIYGVYDYEQNFVAYLSQGTIRAYDYKFYVPVTTEILTAGAVTITCSVWKWDTDLSQVVVSLNSVDYLTITGNGVYSFTVPVTGVDIGYILTTATPTMEPQGRLVEETLYGKTDNGYFYPSLNHYIDEHGDMHIAYRDAIIYGYGSPWPYWVSTLGGFKSLSEYRDWPLLEIDWDWSVLEMFGYGFSGAPEVPAGGVIDTWYWNDLTYPTQISVAFAAAE